MASNTTESDPLERFRRFETLSPFELKDDLIKIAKDPDSAHAFLDAGRGNPNWIATTPREAYFFFGRFGIEESKRVWDAPDLGGMPEERGYRRALRRLHQRSTQGRPGAAMLKDGDRIRRQKLGFEKDAWVHELADAIIGDMYPVPMRMGRHMEKVVRAYLVREMCGDYAAARHLRHLCRRGRNGGDVLHLRFAAGQRICSNAATASRWPCRRSRPIIEIAHLDKYAFEIVEIDASVRTNPARTRGNIPTARSTNSLDPQIKAFFVVNPSNPPSYAMQRSTLERIAEDRAREAKRPHHHHRRRVRHLRRGLRIADETRAPQHDHGLLLLEVLRLHRLAPRCHRDPPG